jgi:AraC-like DNA-binding protein/quercetin dioxygenase-like cupin family protein
MRQAPITPVTYQPPEGKAGEVEATTVRAVVERVDVADFRAVQRPEFHVLMRVTEGRATHMLDFHEHPLAPGSVLWVRPGQVHRWGDLTAYDAQWLIFPAGLLDPETARLTQADSSYGPHHWELAGPTLVELFDQISALANDDQIPREFRSPALTHLLSGLLLQLAAQATSEPEVRTGSEAWAAFRELVEAEHPRHHEVAWYAARLGWSPRTLARATRTAAGRTPKQLIDERVLLEARRLLAHTDLSVADVGEAIGFDDASNFGAWFRLRASQTPAAFRSSTR